MRSKDGQSSIQSEARAQSSDRNKSFRPASSFPALCVVIVKALGAARTLQKLAERERGGEVNERDPATGKTRQAARHPTGATEEEEVTEQ